MTKRKHNLEKIKNQRLELLEWEKALQDWKKNRSSDNIIQALIRIMRTLYPEMEMDNKLISQPITDELIDEHHFTTFSKKNNVQDNFRVIISLPKIHNKGK